MNDAILNMLPSAIGVMVSPLPIVLMILILMGDKAKVNGGAFLAGWIIVVFAVGFVGLNLIGANQDSSGPSHVALIVQLIAGILLLFLAGKNWMSRPKGNKPVQTPGWMNGVNKMHWYVAFGMAILLGGVNPKNLALILGGVAAIVEANLNTMDSYITLTIFVLIASLSLAVPLIYVLIAGERARKLLLKLKGWLIKYNAVIMAIVLFLLGLKLAIQAITELSA